MVSYKGTSDPNDSMKTNDSLTLLKGGESSIIYLHLTLLFLEQMSEGDASVLKS
jgi:hypothetical protein